MGVERRVWSYLVLLLAGPLSAQQAMPRPILQREVEVHASGIRLSEALSAIARDGGFKLSYNAALVNGDSIVSVAAHGTVEAAMRGLLGPKALLKESGEHLIILEAGSGRRKFRATGSVVDAATGGPVARASVYEIEERNVATTDANGTFTVELSGQRDPTALLISRSGFSDTVLYVGREGAVGRVVLQPRERLEHVNPICAYDRCEVEDLGVARLLVPSGQMDQAANLSFAERTKFQASVWPGVGTNKEVGGAMVNNVSFNLLAGYARGLEGFELGVGVNIERSDVKGAQFAGLANLVGGSTKGLQLAGGLNHTMRSLDGVQIAGLGNTVWDTLSGAQIAGGANVVKGGMRGTQVAGACNVTTQSLDGAQVAGGVNVTVKDVRKTQFAGGVNYGRNVSGAQVVGGINVAIGSVGGGQVAGGINYARQVTGGQVTGGINVAIDTVTGGQVGVLNFARVVRGGQVGILNFSDTITGTSVGILSFAWRGYHRFDISTTDVLPFTLALRTGTRSFYNMFSWSPQVEDDHWGFGYGFGTEPHLGRHGSLNIELTAEHVNEQAAWIDAVNILGRFELAYGYSFAERIIVSAGPSFNLLFSDWVDEEGLYLSSIAPSSPLSESIEGDTRLQSWIGFRAGLGVRF